ncbi:MAG TPA: putative lipid II flippase FtsW [Desulfuromonadaceae bacterium]|nr:putative lipid II flippase FtsW [Desulfuromonadaceae bacterium]
MKVAVTTLAICIAALLGLGLVMLYSSSMTRNGAHDLMMQVIWCTVGFVCCVAATAVDYRWLKKMVWPIYGLALVGLIAVFIPHLGRGSHGAHRWISKFGFTCQPSEFAKLALVIVLAWYCDRNLRQMNTFKKGVVFPAAIAGVILGMIFIEPDRGTTILLSAVTGTLLLIAGVRWKHIIIPAACAVAGLAVSILHDPMRMNRIFAWLRPQEHLSGAALQAYQAMMALGSGGWFGVGLGNGVRKLGYLPEIHTDFILANIGEELGLVATFSIVIVFVLIAICGMRIAVAAREPFGAFLAAGITFLICLQAAINIGVVTSALPNKGLPLPFISYGGSNLLVMFTCVGILFSIARHAPAREDAKSTAELDDNPFAARAT